MIPRRRLAKRRRGLTLIEVMVTVSLVGVLVSMLLPAVQSVRETARRVQCSNNVRQWVLATHNYVSSHRYLPPAFVLQPDSIKRGRGHSWSVHGRLLPHIELASADEAIDLSTDWHDQVESGIPSARFALGLCPSEPNDHVRHKDGRPYVAPTSYGFSGGGWHVFTPSTGRGGDGAFIVNGKLTPAAFLDGTSHTLAIAEVKTYQPYLRNFDNPFAPIPPPVHVKVAKPHLAELHPTEGPGTNDPRIDHLGQLKTTGHTVWPDGRIHHAGVTTVFPPNHRYDVRRDAVNYDIDFTTAQEGKYDDRSTFAAVTARSHHVGGVTVGMMDGSVQFLSDSISTSLYRSLGTRAGHESALFDP